MPALVTLLALCVLLLALVSGQEVVELDNDEMTRILGSLGEQRAAMLIEVYAPWCSHCKALKPILDQLAEYIGDGMQIAKLNAVKHKDSALRLNATRYPSLVYVKDGHLGHYHGERTLTALKQFVDRAKLPPYAVLQASEDLLDGVRANHHEGVAFALSLPCSDIAQCSGPSAEALRVFQAVAGRLSMQASFAVVLGAQQASVCKIDITVPDLVPYCLTDVKDLADAEALFEFVWQHNYPLIAVLENHNFHRLAFLNATMVAAVVDTSKPITKTISETFLAVAKGYERVHPEMKLVLGLLDSNKWRHFCKLHRAQAPAFLVLEHMTEMHAVFPIAGAMDAQLTRIIDSILDKSIVLSVTQANPSLWEKIQSRFERYMPWSAVLLGLPLLLVLVTFFFPKPGKAKNQ